jgi:hypothetical protein
MVPNMEARFPEVKGLIADILELLRSVQAYFWLISSGLKKPVRDDVPYTTQALREDLLRVRTVWVDCQASRERDAIYSYGRCLRFGRMVGGREPCAGTRTQGAAIAVYHPI